jgi:predicted transcriptional regulator
MSNDNANKQSLDDSIIDFLSKKSVIDQTEKLALSRISSKMEISSEQLEMSINRLSAKNLIRKIYLQGKVGFELTPKGKSSLEELSKVETARITKQLQEAIQQEQKAKLRMNAVKRIKSIENEWQNYQIPDKNLIDKIEHEATELLVATKEIKEKQPLCELNPQNYEQEFEQYKPKIEKLIGQNSNLIQAVNNYAKIKSELLSISAGIKNTQNAIKKYESLPEAWSQVNQLKSSLSILTSVQSKLENFDKNQVDRFLELKAQIRDNSRLLDNLKKSTHEFKPIKIANVTEKTAEYFDTEGPINDGYKTTGLISMEKCSKCGIKRKSTRVDIG